MPIDQVLERFRLGHVEHQNYRLTFLKELIANLGIYSITAKIPQVETEFATCCGNIAGEEVRADRALIIRWELFLCKDLGKCRLSNLTVTQEADLHLFDFRRRDRCHSAWSRNHLLLY